MRVLFVKFAKKCCLIVVIFTTYTTFFQIAEPESRTFKYILVWNRNVPEFEFLKNETIFDGCEYTNCLFSQNKGLLGDVSEFDAILFSGQVLSYGKQGTGQFLPRKRTTSQIYVFANRESSAVHPLCEHKFDNYFNLTWTYKLDSDVPWPHFSVFNREGSMIGPKVNMKWEELGSSLEEDVSDNVMSPKKLPAVWISSRCHHVIPPENEVLKALSSRGLNNSLLKRCGLKSCSNVNEQNCSNVSRFYFYFAFERSIAEDFVSSNVLQAYRYNVIPVVYGGADYNRFLPPNSYIDARKLGPNGTADVMLQLMAQHDMYMEYLKWQHYFYFSQTDRSVCHLCKLINQLANEKRHQIKKHFRSWWNPLTGLPPYQARNIC